MYATPSPTFSRSSDWRTPECDPGESSVDTDASEEDAADRATAVIASTDQGGEVDFSIDEPEQFLRRRRSANEQHRQEERRQLVRFHEEEDTNMASWPDEPFVIGGDEREFCDKMGRFIRGTSARSLRLYDGTADQTAAKNTIVSALESTLATKLETSAVLDCRPRNAEAQVAAGGAVGAEDHAFNDAGCTCVIGHTLSLRS